MEECMNRPLDYVWTDQDVILEYQKYQDKRKVSRIFGITVKEINTILKGMGYYNGKVDGFYYRDAGLL